MQTGAGDRPVRRPARRVAIAVVAALVVVAAGELGARVLDSRLPEPLEWQSAEAQLKVHQMDALAKEGGADAVFVGSSVVNAGVDPAVFDAAVGHGRSYNAALSAGVPLLVGPWTTTTVLPRVHPKLLLIGVTSFDFYDHPSADEFYRAFADSPAGRRALGDDGLVDRLDRWMGDRSELWAHRAELRDPMTLFDALRGDDQERKPEFGPIEPDGRASYPQTTQPTSDTGVGLPVGRWTLGTRNPAALRRMIEIARAQGIAVALVDMPISQRYVDRHPNGQADYDRYIVALRALATDESVPLFEYDGQRDATSFVDAVHMNVAAARAFTTELVEAMRTAGVLAGIGG